MPTFFESRKTFPSAVLTHFLRLAGFPAHTLHVIVVAVAAVAAVGPAVVAVVLVAAAVLLVVLPLDFDHCRC